MRRQRGSRGPSARRPGTGGERGRANEWGRDETWRQRGGDTSRAWRSRGGTRDGRGTDQGEPEGRSRGSADVGGGRRRDRVGWGESRRQRDGRGAPAGVAPETVEGQTGVGQRGVAELAPQWVETEDGTESGGVARQHDSEARARTTRHVGGRGHHDGTADRGRDDGRSDADEPPKGVSLSLSTTTGNDTPTEPAVTHHDDGLRSPASYDVASLSLSQRTDDDTADYRVGLADDGDRRTGETRQPQTGQCPSTTSRS